MKTEVLFLVSILLVMFASTKSLRCRQCGTYTCSPPPKNCPVGTVTDICNCCLKCGKNEGEACGGIWQIKGKCGDGLYCERSLQPDSTGVCRKLRG